ncbi:MAG: membrane protein insertase YidC [Spirochaetota bacterium]
MDRRTLLAVVLSVIVITIGFSIQSILFPPPEPVAPEGAEQPQLSDTAEPQQQTDTPGTEDQQPTTTAEPVQPTGTVVAVPAEAIGTQERVYQNELIRVTMSPNGGTITSFELLQHLDGDQPVDMIFRGNEEQRAMTLHFGDHTAPAVDELFAFQQINENTFEFTREFEIVGRENSQFTVTRRYTFQPDEYMFEHEVFIRNENSASFVPLNFDGVAYTIGYGPQIGPEFEQLDPRYEFRRYMVYDDGKRDNFNRLGPNEAEVVAERVSWAAVAGKYFAVVAVTDNADLTTVLSRKPRDGIPEGSQLYVSRPVIQASAVEDTYHYYVGPKTVSVLNEYDNADQNAWGFSNLDLREIQETRLLFGWLENILKWILQVIVRVVPNYGVAIIILTIIVKGALWPLTRKSYESNARMQAVQPKMAEIKEKFKDNQQKQNEEMAKLYKKEGVNPLGGCLPLLAQFPFFLAMYGLFNNHFDLRGATFIPGWISDLSAPDVIIGFGDFTIPLIGWTAIRGLPIIFVATQLLSTKLTQTPSATQSSGQMKFMQLGLPVIFFFILYNVPSGLLVYWIFSNILTVGQQYYYNKVKKQEPQAAPAKNPKKKKRP